MGVGSGRSARDPLTGAVRSGRPAVHRRRQLEDHVGAAGRAVGQVRGELSPGVVDQDPDDDLDARGPQPGDALAGHLRVGILDGDDDPTDAGLDDGVGARAGAARVRAGLERGREGGAPRRLTGGLKGDDLGVATPGRLGRPGVGAVRGHDHRPDPGVGRGGGADAGGQAESADHGRFVLSCPLRHPGLLSGTARENAAHGPSLSSGLSPSALEFHQIGPHRGGGSRTVTAGWELHPTPRGGVRDDVTPRWPFVNRSCQIRPVPVLARVFIAIPTRSRAETEIGSPRLPFRFWRLSRGGFRGP